MWYSGVCVRVCVRVCACARAHVCVCAMYSIVSASKVLRSCKTQLLPPSGMPQVIEPCAGNPPGAGLVTHRRTVHVSQVAEPKLL